MWFRDSRVRVTCSSELYCTGWMTLPFSPGKSSACPYSPTETRLPPALLAAVQQFIRPLERCLRILIRTDEGCPCRNRPCRISSSIKTWDEATNDLRVSADTASSAASTWRNTTKSSSPPQRPTSSTGRIVFAQRGGNQLQDAIPRQVTMGVVDLFKEINIQQDQSVGRRRSKTSLLAASRIRSMPRRLAAPVSGSR